MKYIRSALLLLIAFSTVIGYLFHSPKNAFADHCQIVAPSAVQFGQGYTISINPSNAGRITEVPEYELTAVTTSGDLAGGERTFAAASSFTFTEELAPGSYNLIVKIQNQGTEHIGCQKSIVISEGSISDSLQQSSIGSPSPSGSIEGKIFAADRENMDMHELPVHSNTPHVRVEFYNISEEENLVLCVRANQDCNKNDEEKQYLDLEDFGSLDGETVVLPELCGDSKDKLKSPCNPSKDWFHAGSTYRIGLYRDIEDSQPTPLSVAEFYTFHYYPKLDILPGVSVERNLTSDLNSPRDELLKLSIDSDEINQMDVQGEGGKGYIEIDNPISMVLSGMHDAGGTKRNNFQIVIEGVGNNYGHGTRKDGELCFEIKSNDGEAFTMGDERELGGPHQFPPGKYVIKVNERINDTSGFFNTFRGDKCQGGFTYYEVPFIVVEELVEGQNILETHTYVSTREIQVDPNRSEFENLISEQKLELPCEQWVDIRGVEVDASNPDKVSCKVFSTALFGLSTRPTELITDLGQWLLSIASIAAFFMIVYSGYILLSSRGDKEKIGKAREIMTSAITGLIFLILSITILEIIGIDILQIPGFERGN